ncbi:hypothetical protein PM082_018420 [Marasmius tenuissimus]|nr:hypothetical protein PM082_018420 [Marasmius tenuissimus]
MVGRIQQTLHKELLQGVVNRGWGEGQVIIPDNSHNSVSSVGNVKAFYLCHELGTGALAVVESFIKQQWSDLPAPADPDEEIEWVFRNKEDVASWAAWQTTRFSVGSGPQLSPVLFATFVADEKGNVLEKEGMFENELILRVLAVYFAHVKTIPPNKRLGGFPLGALELAIQAVERALVSYMTGRPAISGSFLYEEWGKKPVPDSKGREKLKAMEFRNTIESLGEEKQQAIIMGARAFIKAKGRISPKDRRQAAEQEKEESGSESDVLMSDPPEPAATNEDSVPLIKGEEGRSAVHHKINCTISPAGELHSPSTSSRALITEISTALGSETESAVVEDNEDGIVEEQHSMAGGQPDHQTRRQNKHV